MDGPSRGLQESRFESTDFIDYMIPLSVANQPSQANGSPDDEDTQFKVEGVRQKAIIIEDEDDHIVTLEEQMLRIKKFQMPEQSSL